MLTHSLLWHPGSLLQQLHQQRGGMTIATGKAACHPLHGTEHLLNLLGCTSVGISPSAAPERILQDLQFTHTSNYLCCVRSRTVLSQSLLSSGCPEFRNLSQLCKYNLSQNSQGAVFPNLSSLGCWPHAGRYQRWL